MAEYSIKEKEWIWLSSIKGMSPTVFNKLINYYQDVGYCINSIVTGFDKLNFISANLKENIRNSINDKYIDRLLEVMDKKGIRAVPMFSNQYPALLKHIYDPPTNTIL